MTDLELIRDVLCNYPQHYLMYRGGSGGEFLVDLISQYSDMFRKFNPNHRFVNSNTNRTSLQSPFFYRCMKMVQTRSADFDDLVTGVCNIHKFNNVDVSTSIKEAASFLKENTATPLFHIHISFNEYFTKKNSHVILLDTDYWYNYIDILLMLKTQFPMVCKSDTDLIEAFKYQLGASINNEVTYKLLSNAVEWAKQNNIKTVSNIQIDTVLSMISNPDITFDDIFYNSPVDVFKKYNHINNNFSDYYSNVEPKMRDSTNIIKYGEIFNKGYLEEMFNIESDEFHSKLIQWHDNNLKLMERNEFDITPYML